MNEFWWALLATNWKLESLLRFGPRSHLEFEIVILIFTSYKCNWCRHPFDSSKWGRICRFLILDGALEKNHIVEPLEASKDDLLVVGIQIPPRLHSYSLLLCVHCPFMCPLSFPIMLRTNMEWINVRDSMTSRQNAFCLHED